MQLGHRRGGKGAYCELRSPGGGLVCGIARGGGWWCDGVGAVSVGTKYVTFGEGWDLSANGTDSDMQVDLVGGYI